MPVTSSGQHLLMPNRVPADRNHQIVLVEVNSRDRNYLNLVPSNPMRFQFARPLKDVRSIELLSGTIPANPYNINSHNNRFTFQEGTQSWDLTIPPGTYTTTSLITQLTSLFTALSPPPLNTYTFSQTLSGNLQIQSSAASPQFSLLFLNGRYPDTIDRSDGYLLEQNTPAFLLGFDMSDYYSDSTANSTLISPFPMDMSATTSRLYLYLNFDNSTDLGCIERGAGRRPPFAIIYLDEQLNGYKFLNKDTLTPASYSLPQPYSRLQNLNVEFRDEFYRLINFNGKDFSLLLQITVLE